MAVFAASSLSDQKALSGEIVIIEAGIYFALGSFLGWIIKGPMIISGSLMAIRHIVNSALLDIAATYARRHAWQKSSFFFASALSSLLVATAVAVAVVALNFFTPLTAGIYFAFDLFFVAVDLGHGILRRYFPTDQRFASLI